MYSVRALASAGRAAASLLLSAGEQGDAEKVAAWSKARMLEGVSEGDFLV